MSPSDTKPQSELDHQEADFAKLFEDSLKTQEASEGDLVKGKVVQVVNDWVIVDIGQKSEGLIKRTEFVNQSGELSVSLNDEVNCYIERWDDDAGHIILSKVRAEQLRIWDDILDSHDNNKLIEGTIVKKVKGGFHVDLSGLTAFLPNSQADIKPVSDSLIGQKSEYRVIKFNRKKNNVIISRRAILEKERDALRTETLKKLSEGAVLEGYVKNITDYGAFIDLGGVDGLVHLTDLSWSKVTHPSQIVSVGETIKVKILKIDEDSGKVFLGLKQISDDPWEDAENKFPIGSKVKGRVVNLTDYGAFVELAPGVEGLIHISEMSWTKLRHPSQKLKPDEEVTAEVLVLDAPNRRISLGIKQIEANPWDELEDKYPVGSKVSGEVRNITDFGIFVGINDHIDGLVHISDLSWKKVSHPTELFSKGDKVEAVVTKVDKDNQRFSLSTKALDSDPWEGVSQKYKPGSLIEGTVTSITDFGAFVELHNGLEGLIHISELKRNDTGSAGLLPGTKVEVEVLNVDIEEKKIGLSLREVLSKD